MKTLINSIFSYFLLPLYFSLALWLVFFHVPEGFFLNLLSLYFIVTPIVLFVKVAIPIKFKINISYALIFNAKKHKVVIALFCFVVLLSGPIDVYVNGFKLFDPDSYAEFNGVGRYVRHISILCWTLVPIAFIFVRKTKVKMILIAYAIIFPILIIDRNRLFASFYSLVMCLALTPPTCDRGLFKRNVGNVKLFGLISFMFLIFCGLGIYRSGSSAFSVASSGGVLSEGALPLREIFYILPSFFQQVILYIVTPIFNFATIVFFDFRESAFLLSQFSPFGRDQFAAYPYAPIMVPRFNVGTEFYPWLLYGGLPFVLVSFVFILFFFLLTVFLLKKYPNIFTFLIFLKISYLVLFMGFAPQFYLLLNLAFVILMIGLWFFSSFINMLAVRGDLNLKRGRF